MTYRFENTTIEKPSAIETMIAINAAIAIVHRKGGELFEMTVCSHEEDDGHSRAHLKFRYTEKAA